MDIRYVYNKLQNFKSKILFDGKYIILVYNNIFTFHSQLNMQVAFPYFQRTNMSTFSSSQKQFDNKKVFHPF